MGVGMRRSMRWAGVRSGRARGGLLAVLGVSATVLVVLGGSGPALAAAPSMTLTGSAQTGFTPDSFGHRVSVDASLSGAVASGSLNTEEHTGGILGGDVGFESTQVTCMVVSGTRVVVGALGRAWKQPNPDPSSREELRGEYVQFLDVDFGRFSPEKVPLMPPHSPIEFSYGGLIGAHKEGVPSSEAPSCATAVSSFDAGFYTAGGGMRLSPSIDSPADGTRVHGAHLHVSGGGEPNTTVTVTAHEERAAEGGGAEFPVLDEATVLVGEGGAWSATLKAAPRARTIVLSACADVARTPSNPVEVIAVGDPFTVPYAPGSFEGECSVVPADGFIAPTVVSPAQGSQQEAGAITVTGTGEPNTAVNLLLWEEIREHGGVSFPAQGEATALVDASGNWCATLPEVPSGRHKLLSVSSDVYPGAEKVAQFEVIEPGLRTGPGEASGRTRVRTPGC